MKSGRNGTHYRPLTYRKAREVSKPTASHTRFAGHRQIQQQLARARYAMGSGPVYWIGPAAKTGQQLVGQIGDNPCIVSHFGAGNNAPNSASKPIGEAL
jgi:hypothetical protein